MTSNASSAGAIAVSTESSRIRIVILGGGFGGVYAARRLARRLGKQAAITVVDRLDAMLFTPMLAEVVGRSIGADHAAVPFSRLLTAVNHVKAEVHSMDLKARTVTLTTGQVLVAEHLIVALGSVTNFHRLEGAAQHGHTMKSLQDACNVQKEAVQNVRRAAYLPPCEERQRLLSAVVAGAGYTGVETVAAINELMRFEAETHGLKRDEVHVTLIESHSEILQELPHTLRKYATKVLVRDGIAVRTSVAVSQVNDSSSLTLSDGTTLTQSLLVWNTGIQPSSPVMAATGPKGKHQGLCTDSAFRVVGLTGVWALGDAAETPKPYDPDHLFEYTAQNAIREGVVLADNIVRTLRGKGPVPFRYKQIGTLAIISNHLAVANILGFNVTGVLAWLLWRGVYIAKLPSMRNRLLVTWDYIRLLFGRRFVPAAKCES